MLIRPGVFQSPDASTEYCANRKLKIVMIGISDYFHRGFDALTSDEDWERNAMLAVVA